LNTKYTGEKIQNIKIFDLNGKEVFRSEIATQLNDLIEIPFSNSAMQLI
jgi:hypothetical protein